nr:reverse transcriptase domain-containing protein [Tanacetum cinerariifolium]
MADQRTMAELLRAPTEGYAEAIVIPPIPAEHFVLEHSLINLDAPETLIKLMLFPFSDDGPAQIRLNNDPPRSILTWDDLTWDRFKDLLRACPHHDFIELHQLDTFYYGLNPSDQDSLNSVAGGNLLERSTQDALKIIENKLRVRNSRNKPIVSQVKASNVNSSEMAKLTDAISQCPATNGKTFTGYHDNIQGYVSAAAVNNNYNQGRGNNFNQAPTYQAPTHQPQVVKQSDFQAYMKANDAIMKNMKTQMTSLTNSNIEHKSMFRQFMKMNTASSSCSGSLPSNTIPNPREDLKGITTLSVVTLTGPSVSPPHPPFKEVDREPETITDQIIALNPHQPLIPYPSRLNKEKLQGKYDIQIHSFLQMFKKIHFNISFSEALAHMPKFAKMVKDLITNKEKLLEVANTPVNENCSAMILKKLPEKLRDTRRGRYSSSKKLLNDDPTPDLPPIPHPVCLINDAEKIKSSIDDPPDIELKDLPSYLEYAFWRELLSYPS